MFWFGLMHGVAAAALLFTMTPVSAQTQNGSQIPNVAAIPKPAEQLKEALASIKGDGVAQNIVGGRLQLEQLALTDARAKYVLANMLLFGTDLPKDVTAAIKLLDELAAAGNPGAMALLGKAYLDGVDVTADPTKARELLLQAINLGHANARVILANALIKGQGLPKDVVQGQTLLEDAIAKDAGAKYALASLLLAGTDLPKDPARALFMLNELAANSNPGATVLLGKAYLDGNDVPADPAKARELLQKAIDLGHGNARVMLATALIKGQGLPKDVAQGEKLLEDAISKDASAKYALAGLLLTGKDLPKDGPRALSMLNELVTSGNSSAMALLGKTYLDGVDTSADPLKARELLSKAVDLGHGNARVMLANALIKGQGLPKDLAQGQKLLEDVASKDASAKYALAGLLLNGNDLPKDGPRALSMLNELATSGNSGAMVLLGKAYLDGNSVPVDPVRGRDFLQRAIDAGNANARIALANALIKGQGLPRDTVVGQKLLEDGASKDPNVKYVLASQLYVGTDLTKDAPRAMSMLSELAQAGDSSAMTLLGKAYLDGKDVAADPEKARTFLRQAMALGNAGARINLANALIKGQGLPKDSALGLKLLEETAAKDARVRLALAGNLMDGSAVAPDRKRAFGFYQSEVDAGNDDALLPLANAFLFGRGTTADPALARRWLDAASAKGNSQAKRVTADALIKGQGLPKNAKEGIQILTDVANQDANAKVALVSYLTNGLYVPRNVIQAERLAREAADQKVATGYLILGQYYLSLPASRSRGSTAAAYLRKAANAGLGQAWLSYAAGVGNKKISARPISYRAALDNAKRANIPGQAVTEAVARLYGIGGFIPSRRGYFATLETAAAQGNPEAAKALIRTYRDGVRGRIGKNTARAKGYIGAFAKTLGSDRVEVEKTLLSLSQARGPKQFDALIAGGNSAQIIDRPGLQYEFHVTNHNFQTYRVQKLFASLGRYKGKPDGYLNRQTLKTIGSICAKENGGKSCVPPLASPAYLGYLLTTWSRR